METDLKTPYVFQVDSEIVKDIYKNNNNYLISFNEECTDKNTCAIYFSSNDIYYPNIEDTFRKKIIEKNFFEWYGTRIKNVYKHILVRDVHKQWYLSGINDQINSPEKLLFFLENETKNSSVITVGSSAGGYAAVLYGSLLKAKKAIVFNAQFEIKTLLASSNSNINPFIFRYSKLPISKYYDIKPFINKELNIFYFLSANSAWDAEQYQHIKDVKTIRVIAFNTKHHGIPFLKSALSAVINLDEVKFKNFTKSKNNPIFFTIRIIGLLKTFKGAKKQLLYKYNKQN
ncbi:hypothetical protein [Algibacter sp. L1A34]|uniref:hypothetical protein n=1 Tax=Algibacter sp. L1A34 TaxID=2686365 RepID=UPI00131E256F|nr:hypothetical protein [Algibacter sp. L1A34]